MTQNDDIPADVRPRFAPLKRLLRWAERCLAIVGVLFIVYHGAFNLSIMTTHSMSPTLQGTSYENGEWILTEKLSYWLREPRRWEVVTFRNEECTQVMKRVVGLPGETVSLKDKCPLINGEAVERPDSIAAMEYLGYGGLHRGNIEACGDGFYVLGDNTMDSYDSRWTGPLRREQIIGRAWLVVWPLSRVRFINP